VPLSPGAEAGEQNDEHAKEEQDECCKDGPDSIGEAGRASATIAVNVVANDPGPNEVNG